jgi:hypothetical protein
MHLWIECMVIRESRPQRSFDSFAGLIAVFHALHRLLAPRHPPHALSSLAALIRPSALMTQGVEAGIASKLPIPITTMRVCRERVTILTSLSGSCRDRKKQRLDRSGP